MLPTPAAAASCTAAAAHGGTDATHRGSNRRKSTRLHSRLQQRSCSSVGSVGAWGPAGPTVMLPTPAAAVSRSAAVAMTVLMQLSVPATGARAPGCAAGRNNAAAAQWAVWAPAAQQGPTVMLPTPAAAASCTAAVAHAGTDATHRGSNRRKSTRLHSRLQQRSCSSVGSVGAWGPAGPTVMLPTPAAAVSSHRGSRNDGTDATLRASDRRKSTRLRSRPQRQCSSVGSAGPTASGIMQLHMRYRNAVQPAATTQCSSVGSVGAGGPAGTDRDAADACRSGIMHRGSRTCRYRCNSPWQQPAQEHPAAQPAATTQLQLSGQCGRLGPSRDRP